jgi:exodeoxyribonuclease V beta subunit
MKGRNEEFIAQRLGGETAVWNRLVYDRDGIIEASAGTGKTYALQSIVLKLVSDRENPVALKNILLVTFTEKAAGELKERIREILSAAGLLPSDFNEATICTIHSFCRELLSEYAFENRVPMELTLGGTDAELIHRAVRTVLLSPAVKARYEKTYAALMDESALTTEKLVAAVEKILKEAGRIDRAPPAPPSLEEKEKAFCALLSAQRDLAPAGLTVHKTDAAKFEACQAVLADARAEMKEGRLSLAGLLRVGAAVKKPNALNPRVKEAGGWRRLFDVRAEMGAFDRELKALTETLPRHLAADLAALAWPVYKELKEEAALLTFDDLVTKAAAVIERESAKEARGGRSRLIEAVRRRYRLAFVDEFQDTDPKQWTIFGKLFSSAVNRLPDGEGPQPQRGFLLVVGDPKQAIYGFRGADVETYLAAKKEILSRPGAQPVQVLDKTYRSTESLVEAFNCLFKAGWFKSKGEDEAGICYEDVSCPRENGRFRELVDKTGRGPVTLLEALPGRWRDPARTVDRRSGMGSAETCLPVYLRAVAAEIKRLVSLPCAYAVKGEARRLGYGDCCVLVRGKQGAAWVKRIFAEEGIPFSHYKEKGLFDSVEAEALIALFDFLDTPSRKGNLAALLMTPLFAVHPARVEREMALADEGRRRLLEKWQQWSAERKWNLLFESVMAETRLAEPCAADGAFDRRWSAFRQILDRLLVVCGTRVVLPRAFADQIRSWRKEDRQAQENGALRQRENLRQSVQIMTMHAAKGLEYKVVFVAAGFSKIEEAEEAGEKRLFYVALTRAEMKLYLPWTSVRHLFREKEAKGKEATVVEECGIGSRKSPLLGDGFLAQAISACFAGAPERAVVSAEEIEAAGPAVVEETAPAREGAQRAPTVYALPSLKANRFRWESFSSLQHGMAAPRVADEESQGDDEEVVRTERAKGEWAKTLLPRSNVSGNVFHEIMELLCAQDETNGEMGFAVGRSPLEEALAEDGRLHALILRVMRRHALENQRADGESTARTLARMVWRTLNTTIEIGAQAFCLKDVARKDRLAEVEFVVDERDLAGADGAHEAEGREGAVNGKIDLLVRPAGKEGPVYLLDWKTNSLPAYGTEQVAASMKEAGYLLQFEIYALAVARWLGGRAPAGIAYLYVRGAEHAAACGLYCEEVTDALLARARENLSGALAKTTAKEA